MTSHGDYSPAARAAAEDKVRAAGVFAEHAEIITAALPDVPEGHVLVAIVDHRYAFAGTHHVPQGEIVARVPDLEQRGWAMVFTPGATVADVRRRSTTMADIARQRVAAIDRISAQRGS